MNIPNFADFFALATGKKPYDYQCRLACGQSARNDDPSSLSKQTECISQVINIPTGLGKTAAVVLAWLWNIQGRPNTDSPDIWPRRLAYCLPMRTLVEQTETCVKRWLEQLKLENQISVHVLMGGEVTDDWDIYPERHAILIGTQDMLLSRALNRGYGMSRYRWPMHFGLLNIDCLWVMDETQLMGVGVETSAQLDGFRRDARTPSWGSCQTWWMSATLDDERLITVDHPKPDGGWRTHRLSETEEFSGQPYRLITASKKLVPAPVALDSTSKGGYAKTLAEYIRSRHLPGTLTLVVMNRVSRAREVFQELTKEKKPLYARENVALIHSRFRPLDKARHSQLLFNGSDRIVIATQAVEAGVDVSARLLITELAPWSSLVQRMGRCNRNAEIDDAEVHWVDIQPKDESDELLLPYSKGDLAHARRGLSTLAVASPQALRGVVVTEEKKARPVIRRRDLTDLFDTTPDVCGLDLDISRYVRDGEDNDVQLFWRDVAHHPTGTDEEPPHRDELCRVSITDASRFLSRKTTSAWQWNTLGKTWDTIKKARPGGIYLVTVASGGYLENLGWTGDPKDHPTPHLVESDSSDYHDRESDTFIGTWQTLAEHTDQVIAETASLATLLGIDGPSKAALLDAARWHDIGKAHFEFQRMLHDGDASRLGVFWAKSPRRNGACARIAFRHELASALAWLLVAPAESVERDLVAYLIAAHHGKIRVAIRSLPIETGDPTRSEALFARGIWDGDRLPTVTMNGFTTPEVALDLSFMQMGEGPRGPSWLARSIGLRDRLGPFILALLETVLRAADARASRQEPQAIMSK